MKIILANPRGFCAGVNMAIECVDQVLKHQGAPVYVYHEIVHNKHVVDDFVSRGVTFVNSIEEVPEGATVVYSAHGVSPTIRQTSKQRNLVEIDATCPLVTKVHSEVKVSKVASLTGLDFGPLVAADPLAARGDFEAVGREAVEVTGPESLVL